MATNTNTPATIDTSNKDEFTKALLEAGFLSKAAGGAEFNRISAKGNNLVYDKEVIATYNGKTKEPALIVQLTDMPVEYQSMWFSETLAKAVGRDGSVEGVPSIANRFCKSHFETPGEERKFAEDGTSCQTCPVSPFTPVGALPPEAKAQEGASKCAWKGDIEFYILEKQEDGSYTNIDETLYTMSLPTTGIIEFKGTSKKKLEGSVSAENFMVKLARLGVEKWGKEGLMKARSMLQAGGVIAELHLPLATSQDGSRSYNVASFNPIDIIDIEQHAALPDSSTNESNTGNTEDDDVPF